MLKVFKCSNCGCKRFWRRLTQEHIIDWSREGGVSGHPYIAGSPVPYFPIGFICAECGLQVDTKTAAEMEEEVL